MECWHVVEFDYKAYRCHETALDHRTHVTFVKIRTGATERTFRVRWP
jgi:hypothetical protein